MVDISVWYFILFRKGDDNILSTGGSEEMFKKSSDGERADAAEFWSDGGKIGAGANFWRGVADKFTFITGGAGVDNDGGRFDHVGSD